MAALLCAFQNALHHLPPGFSFSFEHKGGEGNLLVLSASKNIEDLLNLHYPGFSYRGVNITLKSWGFKPHELHNRAGNLVPLALTISILGMLFRHVYQASDSLVHVFQLRQDFYGQLSGPRRRGSEAGTHLKANT